jgi:hypothetical protein
METLGKTTAILSWQLIWSTIQLLEKSASKIESIDLNLHAISSCILSSTALESFSNEISSIMHTVIKDPMIKVSEIGIDLNNCKEIEAIKENNAPNFYERYKELLKFFQIPNPDFLIKLSYLNKIRNESVHFHNCDISIIEENGVIKHYQSPPEVFNHIKLLKINGWPLVAYDVTDNASWVLRISTNAFAFWSLINVIDSIIYVLGKIPKGRFKDYVSKYYLTTGNVNLFEKAKSEIEIKMSEVFI